MPTTASVATIMNTASLPHSLFLPRPCKRTPNVYYLLNLVANVISKLST